MAHESQRLFCERVKKAHPDYFRSGVPILDVGSLDINGSNRALFEYPLKYLGIDLSPGNGVDRVCHVADLGGRNRFEVVISTEALEHDSRWQESLEAMTRLLAPGGLLLITCAAIGRPEHGTARTNPSASPATNDYYRNLSAADVLRVLEPLAAFEQIHCEIEPRAADLYLFAIKARV